MPIETLTVGDEARLRAVRLRALADAPYAFVSTHDEVAARPPASWTRQLRDLQTFVAVLDGRDVGLVRGAPSPRDPSTRWLISMWVDPIARGRGVGRALVEAVIDWARADGAARLMLEVAEDNATARGAYAHMGFTETGARTALPPPNAHRSELDMVYAL